MAERIKIDFERNKEIYKLRESGLTLQEVGNKFSITRERVRQICYRLSPAGLIQIRKIGIEKEYQRKWLEERFSSIPNFNFEKSNIAVLTGMKSGGRDRYRELVRVRDNHTCQACFKVWEKGQRRFDVHHLDEKMEGKSHLRGASEYDANNLNKMITLCHKCHLNLDSVRKKMERPLLYK